MATRKRLRPSARLLRTIGNELISNNIVAVLELVKNSYDADATNVEIKINNDENYIELIDNGIGMSLDIIEDTWMVPATNF
jgi:HSP90 family molecular chaperone